MSLTISLLPFLTSLMAGATITTTIAICSSSSPPPLNCKRMPLIHHNNNNRLFLSFSSTFSTFLSSTSTSSSSSSSSSPLLSTTSKHHQIMTAAACHPPSSSSSQSSSSHNTFTKLYVSGLSFRTTEESLQNAFQSFGQLIEVNLMMDKIANRSRGFAFLRYATKEESDKAIEGMHGKFLDGRVIFVEFAKPRSQLKQGIKQDSKSYR